MQVLYVGALAGERLVEEFDPEADEVLFLHLASLKDAVQLQVRLPVDVDVLVLNIDTLGDEDAFVDVRQTTGKERAELDEVVNANTVLLWLSTASVALLGVFRWIV